MKSRPTETFQNRLLLVSNYRTCIFVIANFGLIEIFYSTSATFLMNTVYLERLQKLMLLMGIIILMLILDNVA